MSVRISQPKKYRCSGDCEHCFNLLICHPEEIEDYKESKKVEDQVYDGDRVY